MTLPLSPHGVDDAGHAAPAPPFRIINADAREGLRLLRDASVHCAVFSSPYWQLRFYGTPVQIWGAVGHCDHEWAENLRVRKGGHHGDRTTIDGGRGTLSAQAAVKEIDAGQYCTKCPAWRGELGMEPHPEEFVEHLVYDVLAELWPKLRDDGTVWVNLGDSYAAGGNGGRGSFFTERRGWHERAGRRGFRKAPDGLKEKDLALVPETFALMARAFGWYVRSRIVWDKPNAQPANLTDRPTEQAEYIFLLSKRPTYYYDHVAEMELASGKPSGNKRRTPNHQPDARSNQPTGVPWEGSLQKNLRTVWRFPTVATEHGYCVPCDAYFADVKALTTREVAVPNGRVLMKRVCPRCDDTEGWVGHFAVFPTELPSRCIKLATSARGCCPQCGAGWRRITEKRYHGRVRGGARGPSEQARREPKGASTIDRSDWQEGVEYVTVGWRPACTCEAGEPVPATVVDLFTGSGTTGVAALALGRHFIGTELNPAYARMAQRRIEHAAPQTREHIERAARRARTSQTALFHHMEGDGA